MTTACRRNSSRLRTTSGSYRLFRRTRTTSSHSFPLGNFLAGIVTKGHPWWHGPLGRSGPSNPRPHNFRSPFQIPDRWAFDHGDYLGGNGASPQISVPIDVPPQGTPAPSTAVGWKEAWTAAFARTRFE